MTDERRLTDPDPVLVTPAEEEAVEGLAPIPIDEGEPGEPAVQIACSGEYDPDTNWTSVIISVGDQAEVVCGWDSSEDGAAAIDLVVNSIPQALAAVLPQLFDRGALGD